MQDLWRNFWYGMSFADFLRTELRWTPERRILTARLFITLMVVSLISVTLRPPPVVAISFAFVMMLGPSMMDYTMTLLTALQLFKLVIVAIGLSVVSLVLWSDQPWFLVPWSFGLITLLLFHSRTTGTPTIAAVLYVAAVLYQPQQPDQNIYGALWLLPSIGMLALGTSIATQLTLWPQDPEKLLRQTLEERFDEITRLLDQLVEYDKSDESGIHPGPKKRPAHGHITRQFTLLEHAEIAHPPLKVKHTEWIDLIMEIDTWFNIANKLHRITLEREPDSALTGQDRRRLGEIATLCRGLRVDFLASGSPQRESPKKMEDIGTPQNPANKPVTLLLRRLDDAAIRVGKALAALHEPHSLPASPKLERGQGKVQSILPVWMPKSFWIDNIDALHYGMKFALGTMVGLFLVQALQWPGIDTVMVTSVVVAQTSLGTDYRKSIMRVVGASMGGLFAYVFIIVLEPALETIAGFMLAIAPVCWLSAWVGSGSPRIAYIGTQIGFSFAHAVLPGYGPITNLESVRDRIVGILLGITIVGVIDYLLWPQHSERMLVSRLAATLRNLSRLILYGTETPVDRQTSADLMNAIDGSLLKALNFLENAQIEPGSNQPGAASRRIAMDLTIDTAHCIARVAQARHRYYSNEAFRSKAEPLLERQDALNHSFSETLLFLANLLEAKPAIPPPPSRSMLMELEQSAYQLTIDPAIDWNTAKSIHACLDLDKILLDYLDGLGSLVDDLAETG